MSCDKIYFTHLYGPSDFDLIGACICAKYYRVDVFSKRMVNERKTSEVIGGYTNRNCPRFTLLRAPNGEVLVHYFMKNPIFSKNFLKNAADCLIEDLSKYFDEDEPVLLVPTSSIGITRCDDDLDAFLKRWLKRRLHFEPAIFNVAGSLIHERAGCGVPEDKFITIKMLLDFIRRVKNLTDDMQFDPLKAEMRKVYIKSIIDLFSWLEDEKRREYNKPCGGNINFLVSPLYDNMNFDEIIKQYLDDEDIAERIIKKYFSDNFGTICASQNYEILDVMDNLFESQMWKSFKEAAKIISTVETNCMPSAFMIANEFELYQEII